MFLFLNIIFLFIFSVKLLSLIKNKLLFIFLNLILSIFLNLQILSIYISNNFIDYKFYAHSNIKDILIYFNLFKWQFALFILSVFFFIKMFSFFSRNKNLINLNRKKLLALSFIALVITSLNGGVVNESYKLAKIFFSSNNDKSFKESLKKINIKNYISPEETKSIKGKNIIVISLESFERAYLNNKFKKLTPNLNQLKNDWSYFNMKQNSGSEWTSGSLYTSLTGFPAFFNTLSNETFQNSYNTEINSITNVLNRLDYDITYLVGNADFSGTRDMLNTFGVDKIIDYNVLKDKYDVFDVDDLANNNIHDKDLFEEAKNIIKKRTKEDNNFALFISTISTHFPNGIYDKRMSNFISPKDSNLEFMISAVDFMIGDFISFLKSEKKLDNTIIYIFPDHLKMGSDSIFETEDERGLYLITNARKEIINVDDNKDVYQIDLPKIILNGSEVKSNIKFLTDFIDIDKEEFISKNINEIAITNTKGLKRIPKTSYKNLVNIIKYKFKKIFSIETKHFDLYKSDPKRFIAHAGGMIDKEIYTNSLEALNNSYKNGFRYFELDILKTADGKYISYHDWENWRNKFNYSGKIPTEKEFIEYSAKSKFKHLLMSDINKWFNEHKDAVLVTDKINEPKEFAKHFIDKDRLMMELFSLEKVKEGLDTGIKSAIVSQNVIDNLKENRLGTLINLGIKDIAVSYRYISKNISFLKKIKSLGINTYVFHVNYDKGIDENYIVKNEMDYIYGMYADKWTYLKK